MEEQVEAVPEAAPSPVSPPSDAGTPLEASPPAEPSAPIVEATPAAGSIESGAPFSSSVPQPVGAPAAIPTQAANLPPAAAGEGTSAPVSSPPAVEQVEDNPQEAAGQSETTPPFPSMLNFPNDRRESLASHDVSSPSQPQPQTSTPAVAAPAVMPASALSLLARARERIQFRKQKKLERIVELASKRGRITNDDVEKLLHVSDATATNYLSQLVREGKLRRAGSPSHASYEPL